MHQNEMHFEQQRQQMRQPLQQNQIYDNQSQRKIQMAHDITQTYQGRVTLEQVLNMSFDRVQQLHNQVKKYQNELKTYQNNNARNNTHMQHNNNISNMNQDCNQNDIESNFTENPIDIILVLLHQYSQIETWLKSKGYYSTVTVSRPHAIQFLNSLMHSQPQFIQLINIIQQQLKRRRIPSIPQNQNNNWNNSISRKRKLYTNNQNIDSNNVKKRKLLDEENEKKLQCLSEECKQKNKELTQRIEIMQTKLDIWECKSEKLNPMSLDELNQLKSKMQNKIKLIEKAEKKIIDNTYKCVACVDNVKNISFDSCSHMALCDKCEASLEIKRCPICQIPYKNIKKINF
eukprot:551365_1